jgi:hypothetical protein
MASPIQPLHPTPAIYVGNVQYASGYAFLQNPQAAQPALLMFDNPFTGILDLTRAAQTAVVLSKSYPPGSSASFNGIMMTHVVNGQNRLVLHLC